MNRSRFVNAVRPASGVLILVEAVLLGASVYIALAINFVGDSGVRDDSFDTTLLNVVLFTTVTLLSILSLGLYQLSHRLNFKGAFEHLLVAFVIAGLILWAIWLMWPQFAMTNNALITAIILSLGLLLTLRFFYLRYIDTNILRRRILVYGDIEPIKAISRLRRRADRRGFQIVGLVVTGDQPEYPNDCFVTVHDRPLGDIVRECNAQEIVVAMHQRRGALPVQELLAARLEGIEVLDLANFMERECRKVFIDLIHPSWRVFGEGFRNDILRRITKRVFDVVVASAALMAAFPVMIVTAIAIKLEDGRDAPIFYRQTRVGAHGVPFSLMKFRSMRVDAESDGEARWAEVDDPRITRVGRWIRKWRIDEIPQLCNVLNGSMSVVGPRPERPGFVDDLAHSFAYYNNRHVVRPGITGWAQLRYQYGSTEHDALEKLQYDLYYVKNHSLTLDVGFAHTAADG